MAPPAALSGLQKIIAQLLRSPEHSGNLYSTSDLANVLSTAADADGDADIPVDALLVRAFTNQGLDEYTLSYGDAFRYNGDTSVLYICRSQKKGSWTKLTYVGRFCSLKNGRLADPVRWNTAVDESITNELVEFLRKESKKTRGKKKKKQKVDEVKHIERRLGKLRNRDKPQDIAVENHVNSRKRPYPSAE